MIIWHTLAVLDKNKTDMKRTLFLKTVAVAISVLAAATSCENIFSTSGDGEIRIAFHHDGMVQTRADVSPSDTNSFLLKVTDSKGKVIYDGRYGAAPSSMMVNAGTYTVKVMSSEFTAPAFSEPQYGDTQTVHVKPGESTDVILLCRQINAGIRLNIDSKFLSAYPGGSLFLKSDGGKLLYSYSEKRIAYFSPGTVSLVLSNNGTDETLLSRSLSSQEIYTINIGVSQMPAGTSSSPKNSITVQLDTARNWISENYVIGGKSNKGSSRDNPFSVSEARGMAGTQDVWIYGFIVGGDLSSSKASFKGPFASRTNIVLAQKSSATDKSVCMSVQLSTGDIRNALNLVDNPGNLGKTVFLRGNICSSYYGIPGIQGLTEYSFQ